MRSTHQLLSRWTVVLPVVLAVSGLAGCGSQGEPCSASGKVTFNGQPIADGAIRFMPTAGTPGSGSGAKISAGQYEVPLKSGMLAGKYLVMITAERPLTEAEKAKFANPERDPGDVDPDEPAQKPVIPSGINYLPAEFNSESKLRAELTAGSNTKDFSLTGAAVGTGVPGRR